MLGPWMVNTTTNQFVTLSTSSGVANLANAGFTTTDPTSSSTSDILDLSLSGSTGLAALASPVNAFAVRLAQTTTNNQGLTGGQTINIAGNAGGAGLILSGITAGHVANLS